MRARAAPPTRKAQCRAGSPVLRLSVAGCMGLVAVVVAIFTAASMSAPDPGYPAWRPIAQAREVGIEPGNAVPLIDQQGTAVWARPMAGNADELPLDEYQDLVRTTSLITELVL